MLVLSRLVGQEIVIGETIRVRITAVKGRRVQIAIDAPDSISIYRREIADQRAEFQDTGCFVNALSNFDAPTLTVSK